MISEYAKKVYNAEICPYCKSETKVLTEKEVYGKEYKGRKIIACKNYPKCDSYVGTHDNGKPLGRLADKYLRQIKKDTHERFDRLWKDKLMTRKDAYKWLSEQLKIPFEYTHIGNFNTATCVLAQLISLQKYDELKKINYGN